MKINDLTPGTLHASKQKKNEVYGVFDSHVAFLIPRKGEHLIYILETIEIGRILKFTVKIQKRVIFWKVLTQTSF